jgi:uncharacterized protein YecE (DUF72 family)
LSGETFVGVSGFSYPKWKGTFYPEDAKSEGFLSYYSGRLGSVEINSSFYAQPGAAMVQGWAEKTGESFRFSFKAPRQITHIMKLGKGTAELAARLSKTLDLLGPRRGPVLYQLPPYLRLDLELLGGFLSETSDTGKRVFEFRHGSWLTGATYALLKKHDAGFCIAETEDMKPLFEVTGSVAYFRLRLDSYDAKAVDAWAEKIRKAAKGAEETYVYLRHDETGANAVLAERLAKTLKA